MLNLSCILVGYPLQCSLVIELVPAAEPALYEILFFFILFLNKPNTKLHISIHCYIHCNVFKMDLQGSTLVGKHLLLHMNLSHGDSYIKYVGKKVPLIMREVLKPRRDKLWDVSGE